MNNAMALAARKDLMRATTAELPLKPASADVGDAFIFSG
jgi:hypothetical protein